MEKVKHEPSEPFLHMNSIFWLNLWFMFLIKIKHRFFYNQIININSFANKRHSVRVDWIGLEQKKTL